MANGIAPDNLYSLRQLDDGMGIGRSALRTMRDGGLRVLYQGSQGFVFGSELIKFIEKNAKETRG